MGHFHISFLAIFPLTLEIQFQLWKSSAEFCATRSLMILSLAQHMISLFHSGSAASRFMKLQHKQSSN